MLLPSADPDRRTNGVWALLRAARRRDHLADAAYVIREAPPPLPPCHPAILGARPACVPATRRTWMHAPRTPRQPRPDAHHVWHDAGGAPRASVGAWPDRRSTQLSSEAHGGRSRRVDGMRLGGPTASYMDVQVQVEVGGEMGLNKKR
ncbi:hypothetical protein K3495_g5929 [Podosphaera aphanis]|nr:hypothetical protein K3495_g5929 [Podosphaera aphanis]